MRNLLIVTAQDSVSNTKKYPLIFIERHVTYLKQPVTGSFELIKNLNTACILNAIRQRQRISRADIARQTGLTPATVSNITAELIELGLIAETERGVSSGGRKPVLLKICDNACICGGVHINSDIIEVAVTNINAEILWSGRRIIENGIKPDDALKLVCNLFHEASGFVNLKKMRGIGVCMHGLVRSEEGVAVFSPNLGWENVCIGKILQDEFNVPVYVENDVRAMSLAESWCGVAQNVPDYVYLYVGAGIGGSIVINNELYKGNGGFAGEFGHTTIEPNGPLCVCGNRGCLQALASEHVVAERYSKRKKSGKKFRFEDVVKSAVDGEQEAIDEITRSAGYIGIEIGNIIKAFCPSIIVINGTITDTGDILMSEIDRQIKSGGLRQAQKNTKIVFSQLGSSAPLKGAVTCVIKELFEYPKKFL